MYKIASPESKISRQRPPAFLCWENGSEKRCMLLPRGLLISVLGTRCVETTDVIAGKPKLGLKMTPNHRVFTGNGVWRKKVHLYVV